MVSLMKSLIYAITMAFPALASAQDNLRPALENSYRNWRDAMIRGDLASWQRATASYRQAEVRNLIVSEKKAFPATLFKLPAPPPTLDGLKFLSVKQKGATAKAAYFGRIDFGGTPSDNLLVLSFLNEGGWRYDRADFVNLAALPDVRSELARGDLSYLEETPEAQPSGEIPPKPIVVAPAKYIAKVYVFSPGRDVQVQVNKVSRHHFKNAKEAETIIGGARDGLNEVQYAVRPLEGGTGKEALTIRVYVLSETPGVQPIKAFEYLVNEGGTIKNFDTGTFFLDAKMAAKLAGGR
jgi:hypothetical protein